MLASEFSLPFLTEIDLNTQILNLIYEKFNTDIIVNLNGHYKGQNRYQNSLLYSLNKIENINKEELKKLFSAIKEKIELKNYIYCGGVGLHRCSECGDTITWECNGVELRARNQCKYTNGYPAYDLLLSIPSGKIVIENDLRSLYDSELTNSEQKLECGGNFDDERITRAYERVGLVHAYIGNSCPGIFRKGNKIYIGKTASTNLGEIVGAVITDLWWYSIADYDDVMSRIKNKDVKFSNIISVSPGLYKITHKYHLEKNEYACISKID